MTHHEGILVTWNRSINVSACGAEIEGDEIKLRIYEPSDTASNLEIDSRFTFSLTDDPSLFYKAALTGQNSPGVQELDDEELACEDDFLHPEYASQVYLCRVEGMDEECESDSYGVVDILAVSGKVIDKKGEGPFIEREDPLVDAMVYATRLHVADEEQRDELKQKIKDILKGEENDIAEKILDHLEGYR